MAEWNNLRGTLITQTILQAPAYQPYDHGAEHDAIYIALPGPPYGSDAAVFLPWPLMRQWIKMYEGTTFVPPEDWTKKLGVKLTLKSMDITTDWTGMKVQVGVQADSSVTGATGTVTATGLLTYGGQGKNAKGEPVAKFSRWQT